MAEQKFVKYGDRMMAMEDGMTLEQVKELMARHFPELADPKIETQKDDKAGKTTYVFSKKTGHKGRGKRAAQRRPYAQTIKQLRRAPRTENVDQRVVDEALKETGDYHASDLALGQQDELARVVAVRDALAALPSAAPKSGSVL